MFSWLKKNGRDPVTTGPDWSRVDSLEKADALVTAGQLVRLQLLPAIFGGDNGHHNIAYVPPFVVEVKAGLDDNTIIPLVQQGKVRRYVASPRYEGRSLVPTAIEVCATDPANFTALIRIWGKALLEREQGAA